MKNLLLKDRGPWPLVSKILIILVPLMFAGIVMDNDFWFTINHGRYILANGFASIEPFTVHEGLAFSFEKWATCVLFYKIYDWFGVWGMYAFMLLLMAVISFLFYKACLIFTGCKENVSLAATALFMGFLSCSYCRTRPQMFSYIFLIAEMICLEKYARTQDRKKLYPLPLLAWLYMQFHSTMLPIFFIMMLPYICDFGFIRNVLGFRGGLYSKKPLLFFFVISAAVTLINPYGYRSFVYLINSLNNSGLLLNINEVKRSSFYDIISCSGPVLASLFVYLAIRVGKKEFIPLRYMFLWVGTFAMALFAVRNNSFFVIMGGLVSAWMLRSVPLNFSFAPAVKKLAAAVIIVCTFIGFQGPYDIMRSTYADKVLDEFKSLHPDTDVTMYTDFNCGSYAEWMGFRCYADPRAEVFLKSVNGKEDILAEVWDTMHARMSSSELQEKYNFDYWLVQDGYTLDSQIKRKEEYELVCSNDGYSIYRYIPNGK